MKTCKNCIDNDDGLCDRKGILVEDGDHCDRYREAEKPRINMKRSWTLLQSWHWQHTTH